MIAKNSKFYEDVKLLNEDIKKRFISEYSNVYRPNRDAVAKLSICRDRLAYIVPYKVCLRSPGNIAKFIRSLINIKVLC